MDTQVALRLATLQPDNEERLRFVRELASRPDETLEELIQIIKTYEKMLLGIASQAIREIGYPRNAMAIPWLVGIVADQNAPGRTLAVEALKEIDADAVVPFFLNMILDWDETDDGYSYNVDGIVSILSVKQAWIRACGPAVVYLLSRKDYQPGNFPDPDYLLSALKELIPDGTYAIPALYDLIKREGRSEIGRLARQLLSSFDEATLKPYQRLLSLLPAEGRQNPDL